jgi:hypothetical protein
MAAPVGNKNAVGNSGGRPPTVKEQIWHKEKWEENTKVRELESKVASGEYSVKDVYLLKALKADTVILKNMADKVLATLIDHTTKGDKFDLLSSEELTERLDNARKGKN